MKLINMVDYALNVVRTVNVNEAICLEQTEQRLDKIYQYALFFKQPLTIGMFVPVNPEGKILTEPIQGISGNDQYEGCEMDEWIKAQNNIIFKGFKNRESRNQYKFVHNERNEITEDRFGLWLCQYDSMDGKRLSDIESLIGMHEIELTESAIKQLGI